MNDIKFSNLNFSERPTLIFKRPNGTPIGATILATNVSVDLKYNETSSIEFELPYMIDGVVVPFYDEVKGMRLVELKDIGQFVLVEPKDVTGARRYKSCKGYSLEYEFTYKKISIAQGTYRFYDAGDPESTVLGMIAALMPSWSVGNVPSAVASKYRTFEISNENVYNFMKGTVQKTYGCIFEFDTNHRIINVRDVNETGNEKAVYISAENLAKEIELTENTEDLVTRLDVNGAEGVNIREVNPTGTNQIIDLSYYMTADNFDAALINKYFAWESICEANQVEFRTKSAQYASYTSKKIALQAELRDLQGEMTSLENQQAVIIQAIAQKLQDQPALEAINQSIAAKQGEIDALNAEISNVTRQLESMLADMKAIRESCAFESYFTLDEQRQMDKYIRDGEVSDSSFVVASSGDYTNSGVSENLSGKTVLLEGATANSVVTSIGTKIYSFKGGTIRAGDKVTAAAVSGTIDVASDNDVTISVFLNNGNLLGNSFPGGNLSITGVASDVSDFGSMISIDMASGYSYLTFESTQQEKQSVAQELYEYGKGVLEKICRPSYTFSVSCANFLAIKDFEYFKDQIELGEKLYVKIGDSNVLRPFCTGVKFSYDDIKSLDLKFSDTYVSGDNTFKLVDLLDQSVSMGKSVDLSRFIYSSFVDSGASTSIRNFMESALDVAKNAIISSTGQAPSMDGAGLRLRKWADETQTTYEPEQIWMNNNSIVMTDDNWVTAEMAIGKFRDENLGECWGIVAPMIVGSIIAGENLIIESAKKDGGVATFRMDADGCRLFNADFAISDGTRQILLNNDYGIAIGKFPLTSINEETGETTFLEDNANFWVDADGNLHFKGILEAASGIFHGDVQATSLTIVGKDVDEYIGDIVDSAISDSLGEEFDTLIEEIQKDIDGKTTIYYGAEPTEQSKDDMWYDTANGLIKRYDGEKWVDITDDALKAALNAAGTAQATADGKICTYAQNEAPDADSVTLAEGDLWIDTNDGNKLYRWSGTEWVAYQDSRIANLQNLYNTLADEVDGKSTTYYSNTMPTGASAGDIWYYTSNGYVFRYDGSNWVDITDDRIASALEAASNAVSIADGKINSYAQNEAPAGLGSADIGDLWFDTDDNNKLYRWNGTSWVDYRDGAIEDIRDGTTGIAFSNSVVTSCLLNNQVGLKISGNNAYFQAMNNALGFFKNDGKDTPLMYCQNGDLVLTGTIYATAGNIGSSDSSWKIGSKSIYSGTASSLGSAGGTYIGTDGISLGAAIVMDDKGNFKIRSSSSSSDEYGFAVIPETAYDADGTSVTSYNVVLNDVSFGNFVLPIKNGGTGADNRVAACAGLGIYRANSEEVVKTKFTDAQYGDICVVYPDMSSSSATEVTISGTPATESQMYSAGVYPYYFPNSLYNETYTGTNGQRVYHNTPDYFGISALTYFNAKGLGTESNISTNYARVGRGNSDTACGAYVPLIINTRGASISTITLDFSYCTTPSGASRDLVSEWSYPIKIAIYGSGNSYNSYGKFYGDTSFTLPSSHQVQSSAVYSATVVINLNSAINSSGGIYYAVFYGKSKRSLMWIDTTSVGFGQAVSNNTELALYVRHASGWTSIASVDGEASYILPAATSTTLGGVKIGSGISISQDGTISMSLAKATGNTLGGVIVGNGLAINANGVLSVDSSAIPSGGVSSIDYSYTTTGGQLVAYGEDSDVIIYGYGTSLPSSGTEGQLFFLT